ncbi:MAG TPA: ABC transporter permease [Synergistaceae bacterium]|nr:ABC transporter permease [Synergistaceae bacterium]HPJ25428.1 ABC transporter permease [Synergistaceae bacterium]HPQ37121.1 ABC transporter permease [Synergistaceae bacterium]
MSLSVETLRRHRDSLIVLGSFGASLLVGAGIIALYGVNPLEAYGDMISGALGDSDALVATLARMVPIALATLSIAVAFNGGMWNIGAEGQLYVGAFAAAWIGLVLPKLPGIMLMPLGLTAGIAAAAFWAWIPGVLSLRRGLNIVVLTIMLNSLGIYLTSALVTGPYAGTNVAAGATDKIPEAMRFVHLSDFSTLNTGIFVALGAVICISLVMLRTVPGYDWRMCRMNPRFARYGGVDVAGRQLWVMLLSGAFAGLAGSLLVMGDLYRFRTGLSPGYTWTGMILAMMVAYHPLGGMAAAFVYAVMSSGALEMELMTDVPVEVVEIILGTAVLFVTAGFALSNRLANRLRED